MTGSIREALEGAIEENEKSSAVTPAPTTNDVQPTEPATDLESASTIPDDQPAAEPPAEKPEEPIEAGAKPAEDAKPTTQEPESKIKQPTAAERQAARLDRPPQSWKREAKGEWAALPLQVRQEIHKREFDINKVLTQVAPERQLAEQFKQAVSPHMARIQSLGKHPVEITSMLFQADHILSTAPKQQRAQYMAQLIKDYDIDITELDSALVGEPSGQPQGPNIDAIVDQRLQQALAPLLADRQRQQEAQRQAATDEVNAMVDNPNYPFFEEVRMDMADLIDLAERKGVPLSLNEAYNKAVRMNPETFSQLTRQSALDTAAAQHQAALKAKSAASSIPASPVGTGGQSNSGDGTLRGALEAAFGGARL